MLKDIFSMSHEVWSFIESEEGKLRDTAGKMAAESCRTAKIFDGEPCGVIFSSHPFKVSEELKWYGLKKIYFFRSETPLSPEMIACSLHYAAVKLNPQFILFANTPLGVEIGSRLAASLQKGFISNCTDFELEREKPLARKSIYGGKVDALITWMSSPPYLATINLSALENVKTKSNTEPEIIHNEVVGMVSHTQFIEKWKVSLSKLSLKEAKIVIGVGKGVEAKFMQVINMLGELIGGVVGGTRIAVFSGLISVERLIGTTGKWLNSDVYIAIGISGAPQHVMGIKETKNIIAINISNDAPIFKYAKLGIVGDLYKVVPSLINIINETMKKGK